MHTAMQAQEMDRAFQASLHASIPELASKLQSVLSRTVTAFAVNVKDGKTVSRWANGEISQIRDEDTERRVRMAYQIVTYLEEAASPQTVRAWFVQLNPRLGDIMPSQAIRDGRLVEVRDAAQAFVVNP